MVFGSMLTTAELEFSRTSLWSMVSILDSVHCFSFQFIKNGSTAMYIALLWQQLELAFELESDLQDTVD